MEVVVLLVAIVGITLLVVPRVQRRKAGARRPANAIKKSRRPASARKAAAAPIVAAPAVASWSPPAAAESAGPDADVWEDDLGWEGGEDAAPSPAALEAWEQWRTTDSPLAAAAAEAEPELEPEAPELPSVERWRAQAEEEQWVEDDDDGLGWEGEEEPPAPRKLWNAEQPSPAADQWVQPTELSPAPDAWNSGRDWSRRDDASRTPAQGAESAPAFATASMTDVASAAPASPVSEPELGRTIALDEDDEWDAPVGRSWGAPASAPAEAAHASRTAPARRSRLHPVLLVAIYAAFGIGAVVLASTVLLGGSDPSTAAVKTPAAKAKPSATPATPRASATPDPAVEASAVATREDFTRETSNAVRGHDAVIAAALADARRVAKQAKQRAARLKAAAERKRKAAARKRNAAKNPSPPSPTSNGGGTTYTPPAQTVTPRAPTYQAPPTKRRSVCEFCIG